tara:strand:- start:335 stop:532 length:198 start_codon:yes stop_codon:yes gene_type:complete
MVNGIYYTTADVKRIFGWSSNNTIHLKRASGFLPPPDLEGRPNKWLKSKIDAMVSAPNSTQNNDS